MGWQPIDMAPYGREFHLRVIEGGEVHSLGFPCWRLENGWLNCLTNKRVTVDPTHWRNWEA